jgi:enoyl-CoA hydratase/carnithine racemase
MADGDHVIGQPEILLGFPPGGGGTQRLSRLVGTHRAMTMMLEGAGLDPQSAAEIGYIDEVVDPDSLIECAVAHADRLARRVKGAVAAVKRSAYLGGSQTLEHGLHLERAEFLSSIGQPGAQQAMAAYIEQTDVLDDLPAYDEATFARMRAGGGLA